MREDFRRPSSCRGGSALVVTLGLLAVLALLVFAFAFSARTERFAARHDRDRVVARQYLDVALAAAMEAVLHYTTNYNNGSPAPFFWVTRFTPLDFISANAFVSLAGGDGPAIAGFFDNACTNLIPASLLAEVRDLEPRWIPIVGEEEGSRRQTGTNGFIAYAVINCSGLLDAHCISSNQAAWLRQQGVDIGDDDEFLRDRARDMAPGSVLTNYLSLRDLTLRNRGIRPPVENLFTVSWDPGPDVTVTNGDAFGNRDVLLTPKLDVNGWTNGFRGDLSDPADLAAHYRSTTFREGWLREATNRFAAIGFAAPEALAWNLVNFMDADRIPQGPGGHLAWQAPWPVEDVPLINEIAVAQVPLDFEGGPYTNRYAPAVELWHPFVTNAISGKDEAQLVVAVYTNWPPDDIGAADNWIENVIWRPPGDHHGLTFSNAIPRMEQGTDTEFVTLTMPPPYISFPVTVTNAVGAAGEPFYRQETPGSMARLVPAGDDEWAERFSLTSEILWLPLGHCSYGTYESADGLVYTRVQRTVTNEIRLLARVQLGTNWVDEAMGYHPGDPARSNLVAFLEPCGYDVDDPRCNGHPDDWRRYDAAMITGGADGDGGYACTLSGATNAVCDPWHLPWGQGLPLVHFNEPLRRAGDIGHIQQPERFPADGDRSRTLTNRWRSICLADPSVLGTNSAGYSFSAGSVLEFFTARAANTPVRGLVHYSTTHTNVVRALMAELEVGRGAETARMNNAGIEWLTEVYAESQRRLYGAGVIPVGAGDLCHGFGLVEQFRRLPAEHLDEEEDEWHWQDSLGNDLKEDILRALAERVSFRQQVFLLVLAARTATPGGRIAADQRAAAVVLRDACSGCWRLHSWERLER